MAKRVTQKDILEMNKIYATCHSYAKVAELTGWSESTARKYVDKDFKLEDDVTSYTPTIYPITDTAEVIKLMRHITCVQDIEMIGLRELWEEMVV